MDSKRSAILVAPTSIMITGARIRTSPALALLPSPPSARAVSTTLVARVVLVILTSTTAARTPGEVLHSAVECLLTTPSTHTFCECVPRRYHGSHGNFAKQENDYEMITTLFIMKAI